MAINVEIPPIPYHTPMVGPNGLITNPWVAWFRQMFNRIGGNNASLLDNPMDNIGQMIYGGASGIPTQLAADLSDTRKFLRQLSVGGLGTAPVWDTLQASDIPALAYVTSVAMTVPSIMSVAGSPITSAGTLAVSLVTQSANLFFAGPASGVAAAPTFRAPVIADIAAIAGLTPRELPASVSLPAGYVANWPYFTIGTGKTLTVVDTSVLLVSHGGLTIDGTLTVDSGGEVQID